MDRGLFEGTFYVIQKPFYTNTIPLHLNDVQDVIYHNIVSSGDYTMNLVLLVMVLSGTKMSLK